jgi:hypothetical protein
MKRSNHIEAPVEKVFDSFKDPGKFADLDPGGTQVDEVKATKEGAGTYMSWHAKIVGVPVRGFEVLTDVVPNKHITSRSSFGVVGTWDYDFEPEGSGTKVTLEHHLESFWRIPPLRNLMNLVTERLNDSYMARVKDAIETQGN